MAEDRICALARKIMPCGLFGFIAHYREEMESPMFWGNNLLRSATSVAAHYREACRAKSDLDFISKLEGAQQELDESELWLELLSDSGVIKSALVQPLRQETNELIAIFVTMTKNVKTRRREAI